MANYPVAISMKRKELEVVNDLSLFSLPKRTKLQGTEFLQFMEEGEESSIALLFEQNQEEIKGLNNNILYCNEGEITTEKVNGEMDLMEIEEERGQFHQCYMIPKQNQSPYLWSGFF